jgi:hypothetical protein
VIFSALRALAAGFWNLNLLPESFQITLVICSHLQRSLDMKACS